MNNKILPLLALSLVPLLQACIFVIHDHDEDGTHYAKGVVRGSGVEQSETRTVAPFHRIDATDAIGIDVKIGGPQSITVRADDNFVAWVSTTVEGDALTIRWRAPNHEKGSATEVKPRVEIVVPALDGLALSGSGNARVSAVSGPLFTIDVSGSGDVRADGKVDRLSASVSGSGDLSLFGLEAREVTAAITGSGDIERTATESLHANVAGSGDVRFRGDPKDVKRSIAGSGSVEHD